MPGKGKASSADFGLLAILATPELGVVLLIVAVILVAILLGFFAAVYLTLQAYHLMTAAVFHSDVGQPRECSTRCGLWDPW